MNSFRQHRKWLMLCFDGCPLACVFKYIADLEVDHTSLLLLRWAIMNYEILVVQLCNDWLSNEGNWMTWTLVRLWFIESLFINHNNVDHFVVVVRGNLAWIWRKTTLQKSLNYLNPGNWSFPLRVVCSELGVASRNHKNLKWMTQNDVQY